MVGSHPPQPQHVFRRHSHPVTEPGLARVADRVLKLALKLTFPSIYPTQAGVVAVEPLLPNNLLCQIRVLVASPNVDLLELPRERVDLRRSEARADATQAAFQAVRFSVEGRAHYDYALIAAAGPGGGRPISRTTA